MTRVVVGAVAMALALRAAAAVADEGSATAGARSGEDIYKTSCVTCHAAGVAGAPKLGDTADWELRIEKGMDVLYASVIEGVNAMPPKGMCMDCSEEELKTAVGYMVEASK